MVKLEDRRDNGRLASILGYSTVELPIKYLGLPLGSKYEDERIWELVIEMFVRRLADWKRKFLSKGGRSTFIKSTLNSLPGCYLLVLTILMKVAKRLEAIQRKFLWGDEEGMRKYHLVK